MQSQQLRQALRQTLENYQRCGLRRIATRAASDLPSAWLETVKDCRRADETDASRPSAVPPPTTSPPPKVATSVARPALVPTMPLGSQTVQWTRPALTEIERQTVFSELNQQVRECRLCQEICGFRQQTVFGIGPLRPTVCFMGEAPGADEDRTGEPFVGKAGQLLTRIIGAMQLRREDVYILNALKCRPPGNRTPLPAEIINCHRFVETQLETLQPRYIVCLGAVAVRSLLGLETAIGKMRGRFYQYRGAHVVVTYHPSYLLRNEQAKRLVWEDMQMLMRELGITLPNKA